MARTNVSRRRRESECRDKNGVLGVRKGCPATQVFANERDSSERIGAVVVVGQAGRRCGVVVTPGGGGLMWITPRLAQQDSVLSDCQGQRDRHDGCSKHVKLASIEARRTPRDYPGKGLRTAVSPHLPSTVEPGLRNFPTGCRKSRSVSFQLAAGRHLGDPMRLFRGDDALQLLKLVLRGKFREDNTIARGIGYRGGLHVV